MVLRYAHSSRQNTFTRGRFFFFLLTPFLFLHLPSSVLSQSNQHLYSTGSILELDRCASAWLIKRYVDPEATFKFFPDGEFIPEGVAFDTPDARLTRTHNLSTFEIIMQRYAIDHDGINKIAQYVHDVEINFWSGKKNPEAARIEQQIRKIINHTPDQQDCLEKCFVYFDNLLERLEK